MKLLKTTLVLTISAMFMVASVFAGVGSHKSGDKVKPLIDIASVHDTKMQSHDVIDFPANINNFDHGEGVRDTEITIELWDSYGDGWNGNILNFHCETHGDDFPLTLFNDGYYDDGSYASYTIMVHDGDWTVTCDGGSWQGEVSWSVTHVESGQTIIAGGAPYGPETFTMPFVPSGNPGCTDTNANNYGYNCDGEEVGIPDSDDGCCTYDTPPNDECANAEPVGPEYPVEVTGSSEASTPDCPNLLNWNAVWYELALPYDYNIITINIQAEGPITNGGIIVMDDCECDDYIPMAYNFDPANGFLQLYMDAGISGPDNGGSILYPMFIDPPQAFTLTIDVQEEIWGCTDPNANNYNPDATNDDGSCVYDPCDTSWDLLMHMWDSWGDGWNGNVYEISDFSTGEVLYSGTLETGTEGVSTPICLDDGNYGMIVDYGAYQGEVSWELNQSDGSGNILSGGAPYSSSFTLGETDDILGCMDPDACNYNPDATIDDGTCGYEGEDCVCAYDAGLVNGDPIYGSLVEEYDEHWYSFEVDDYYDNLTISLCDSDFDTKLDIYNGCDNFLVTNDDSPECGLQSQFTLTPVEPGTGWVRIYGFGSSFGNYVLTLTAFNNPTSPTLTATGIPGAVALSWEEVITPDRQSASEQTTVVYQAPNRAEKNQSLDPVLSVTNPAYEPGLRDTDVVITCGGGSWESEVSWQIYNDAGEQVASGGAPFEGTASLSDGVYTVDGQDSYGDGWNGNYLVVFDMNTGTNYLNWTIAGSAESTSFEISSAAVYGCTDPDALNYNYNCEGDAVEATHDDGCCEYPTPANDNCEDAELVTGPYPVEITSSSYNAQVDCEGVLNWNAVWYELELPYASNNVDVFIQADGAISNAGIILTTDCSCDGASSFIYSAGFEWDPAGGWLHVWYEGVLGEENGGTILHPLFVAEPQGYTVTYTVTEQYLPSFNLYRDGESLAAGVLGESYLDSDVTEGTEYCYTCEQIMPDGSISDMSNTACASPDAGTGGGDTVDDPFVIESLPYTAFGSTEWYLDDYDEVCPYTGSLSPDVVYSYTPSIDENLSIDLCGEGTDYDTKLYVYENAAGNLLGCNDDACSNSTTNYLSALTEELGSAVPMSAGNTYYIVVDGYGSQFGNYELNITSDQMCNDDSFEPDDTKDQATDHGGNGTWDYALCADDNPDGPEQPGGFTAIDWSVVTVDPWSNLTVGTVGDPEGTNDIDLFVEDYDGDGICAWGGGDDLAGSGNAFTEEEAVYSNLSDESMTVYVGVIYFAATDNEVINYSLSIEVEGVSCPECPQNLTASSGTESIDLAWDPPYVSADGGRSGTEVSREFSRDLPLHKKLLQQTQSKGELKISGLHPYAHGGREAVDAYNNEMKFQRIHSDGRPSVASSFNEMEERWAANHDHNFVPGLRGDLLIYMWDAYGDGWNGNMLTIGSDIFTIESGDYGEATLFLDDGTYPVTCGGGSWQSEVSWSIVDAASGSELLVGGAPFEGELLVEAPPPPECEGYEVTINCDGGSWQSEVSWQITDADGNEVAAGGAPWTGEHYCLEEGMYYAYGWDSYGDGWNGNMLSVTDENDGTVYLNWAVETDYGETTFELVPAQDVYGCTDPDAANYNPDATIDDGSCVYWGDVCDYPLEAMAGDNSASGENQFFHYTVSADGSVTISSDDGSGAAADTYLYVLGSCSTDEDGNLDDVLGYNDDCCGYYGPSTVELNVTAGQELTIYWYNAWGPGPFAWTIEEGGGFEECVDDEFEDNDGSTSSAPIGPGSYDLVHCAIDPDWFEITVNNGQSLRLVVTEGDQEPSGMMDVGIWVFEVDDTYTQVYSPDQTVHDVQWANTSDHPMVANFAVGDFWAGAFEGTYNMVVELIDFDQTTYTVYRDGASIASDLLLLEYSDMEIADNVEYCYTVTANLAGAESPHSNQACETHVYIEPPEAPTNVAAEGGWLNVGGVDYPAVTWSWDYELPEGTDVIVTILTDNYGGETSWNITNSAGTIVMEGSGYDSNTEYTHNAMLENGDYVFTIYDTYGDGICCSYGEGFYEVSTADGTVLASGGEFGLDESTPFTLGGGRDESTSVFNINDGSSEFVPGSRDIIFELCFEYYGTDYCFQTTDLSITIYGFVDGDLVCGWAYAVDAINMIYSDPSETACANAGGSGTQDVTVDHAAGWNMVSVAVGTDASGVGDLFSGFIGGTLYEYPYNAVEALTLGQGYWLRFDSDGSDTQTGEPVDDLGINLSAGWNLIGSVTNEAGIGDPDGVVIGGTLYGYPYSDEVTALIPGSGYWLRASADGMVYLSTSAPLPRISEPMAGLTANSLTINGMKLHFGVDVTEEMALSHSLPPKPPAGSFDVRFAGDTKIAEDAAVIDVMNSTTELTIDYNIVRDAGDHMLWVLATESDEFVLEGMGSIILPGSVTSMTLNKVAEVPETFGLSQNFPNPFNPVTNISFQVPEASDITVSVYNMMGQKVADLVQGHVDAGYHQVVWDSRNLQGESVSSGVYLYTITSGDFHAMKKMILMK